MISPGMLLQNRYEVVKSLGKGGCGEVFEISDHGNTKVLKVLLSNYNKNIELFQREAEILKKLNHPGIPKVEIDGYFTYQYNDCKPPLHCLVMEKIEGVNLEEWLRDKNNQPLSQKQAIIWLKQLLEILGIVHQEQYFHRDIKPSNIMLKPDGQLVLIDFGVAREITDTYLIKMAIKEEITRVGSSGYVPLEQLDGAAYPQSDFFALGRTIVHLLTAKHPSQLINYQTGDLIWRDSVKGISSQFADLIDWLIKPFPGQRPQNTEIILQCLDNLEFFIPPQPFFLSKAKKEIPLLGILKRSVRFKIGMGLLLLLGGLISLRAFSLHIADDLNEYGYQDYENNRLDSAKSHYNWAILLNNNLAESHYYLGVINEEKQQLNRAFEKYKTAINVQEDFERAYNNLARLHILNKNYSDALPLLIKGLKLTKDNRVKYSMLKNLGWLLLETNHNNEAKNKLQMAIQLDNERTSAHCLLAQVWERQENIKESVIEWKSCLRPDPREENRPERKIWLNIASQRIALTGNKL